MKRCILEYTKGLLEKTVFAVENESTIGRSPRNAVHLPDPEVSRFHALIRREPEGWVLMDLGSRNGTFVNGEKIDRCLLKSGDLILLGQSQLRFLESEPSQEETSDLYETQELAVEERPSQEIQDQMGLVRTFLDALPVGVAIVNEAMEVLYGNKALPSAGAGEDFHGSRSLGEVLLCLVSQEGHVSCAESSSCDDCPLLDAAGQVFGEGVSILGREIPWYNGDHRSEGYARFSMLSLPYRLTGQALALLSWEDITPQMQARQALEHARADLERRVMERTSELREANLRLKQEVEERKTAESRLRRSETRFRLMAENSPFPIAMLDAQGRYIYINPKFTQVTGYTLEDIPDGRAWFRRAYPDGEYRRKVIAAWKSDLKRYGPYQSRPRQFVITCKDGTRKEILFRCVGMEDGSQFLTLEDMTQRKQMEEEILKAQKLESIGVLAGGIAHDFNNILAVILGNISLAKLDLTQNERVLVLLEEAEKACSRAQSLTQQLLTFSKGGAPLKKAASLTEILKESAIFALRGSKARPEFHFQEGLWLGEVDPGQISHVIHNLVLNADQAMPNGGVIEIRAENVEVSPDFALPLEPGKYIRISVKDQGMGIPQEHRSRLFDPYFTTKQKGSGLGLATVYSIVKRHGGHVTVESRLGEGSTFHVYLPALDQVLQDIEEEPGQPPESPIQGVRLLVMDDEEGVRELAKAMLQRLGYEVETVADGGQAVQTYREALQKGRPFDAVILDLTIPGGMGGKETLEELRQLDPNVRALVSSGYSIDPVMSDLERYGFQGVIPKPYRLEDLSRAVQAVLPGPAAGRRQDPS